MKKDSTLQDIHDNLLELTATARKLLETVPLKEIAGDWWHQFYVNGKNFDINIYETTNDDDVDVIVVTAYAVGWLTDFDAETITDQYVRLLEEPLNKKRRFQSSLS